MQGENEDPRVLLDTSTPFDEGKVCLLDKVANAMYSSSDTRSREVAHKVLSELQNQPQAWTYVAFILSHSKDANTKFFALRILENCIVTRWQILPDAEKAGIKQYVSELTLQLADDELVCTKEKHFINKVNEVLVQIVKHEWPDKWPTFISEICKSSKAKQSICENNMRLLVLLSEEVFDFGSDQMSSKKLDKLQLEFVAQFREVFDLCTFIIQSYMSNPQSVRPSLITQTLQCLAHFLKWIPLPFVFETQLIETLLDRFWDNNNFRIDCVRCLSEVCGLTLAENERHYLPKLADMWNRFCNKLAAIPADSVKYDDTSKVPRQMRSFWETFYVQLTICLTAFLKNHRESVAEAGDPVGLQNCMALLVRLTEIPHDETFKICLDFWNTFAETLLLEVRKNYEQGQGSEGGSDGMPLMLNSQRDNENGVQNVSEEQKGSKTTVITNPVLYSQRLQYYSATLIELRRVLIERMAKPQEIYIQYDQDTGEVTREYHTDTDEVALYNTMRDTQVLLTNLGQQETKDIILSSLMEEQSTGTCEVWNPTFLNRLCYSIGSISGAMDEKTEHVFLVQTIKSLLYLCEMKKGKQNKAIVASNIMYVVGQYPRFLRQHARFLKTVILKLFEFMCEDFPGIEKMACETFVKISQKCATSMATTTTSYTEPFLDVILKAYVVELIPALEDKHKLLFYQAVGHVIAAAPPNARPAYLHDLMSSPNATWNEIMGKANGNPENLFVMETAKEVTLILTINQAVARSAGAACSQQLMAIYPQLLTLYGLYSKKILSEISVNPQRINHADLKIMLSLKREVLHLVEAFIVASVSTYNDNPENKDKSYKELMDHFVYPLLDLILEDYRVGIPSTRECEVLAFVTAIVGALNSHVAPYLPQIFECLFTSTLHMIKADFHSYPDHRAKFYEMLMMCNRHCFDGLFGLPQEKLRNYVESLVWAFQHEHPGVADQGLHVTYEFMQKLINEKRNLLLEFCRLFYFSILQEVLRVLTDTLHRSGFKYQTLILMSLVDMLESEMVNDESIHLTKQHVVTNLVDLLDSSFETVNRKQAEAFVLDLFTYSAGQKDRQRFQTHVRDFLICLKEFAGSNDEFFELEKQEAISRAKELDNIKRSQIPGMTIQPS